MNRCLPLPKLEEQQSAPRTNVPNIPSTGVSTTTTARRSHPKSNTTHDKTLPAKSVPNKKVEEHPRKNKLKLSKTNHVDSSISVRRTVIDTNSNSLCKTCNECLNSSNHVKCVEHFLKSYNKSPVKQICKVKQVKQTWKPTGKLFTRVGHHWKPTGRTLPLGAQCPLTRKTTPKVVPVKIWKPTGRIIPLRGQCPLTRPTAPTSHVVLADPRAHHAPNCADNMANEHVPSPATIRSDDQILSLTASADVPSSFTTTTKTTSTLPPSPPPRQQSTVHRDIW
ncbi:hypothetical protein Tco_0619232 [Tanacetum coccineum]